MSPTPTGPLRPGEGQDIIPSSDPPAEKEGVRVISVGLTIGLNADTIVAGMADALLSHHRKSILSGQRPDGGGAQAKLGLKAASVPGRLTEFRGARTGHLADELHRTAITGDTAKASCKIEPPDDRIVYVRKEAKLGRQLITSNGEAGEVGRRAAKEMVDEMAKGQGFAKDNNEKAAKET